MARFVVGAEQAASGDFVVWGEGEPRREMFFGGPSAHVGADFGDQFEGGIRGNAVDLRQIHAAGNVMERGPDIETGFVVAGLSTGARTGERWGRGLDRFDQRLDVSFDGLVANRDLGLTGVEKFEILPEGEEVFGPVVAGEGGGDFGLGGAATVIAMFGEPFGIALPGDDVAENAEAGYSGDVADGERELQIHLNERFLHALDAASGGFDQGLTVAEIGAEGGDFGSGAGNFRAAGRRCEVRESIRNRKRRSWISK